MVTQKSFTYLNKTEMENRRGKCNEKLMVYKLSPIEEVEIMHLCFITLYMSLREWFLNDLHLLEKGSVKRKPKDKENN